MTRQNEFTVIAVLGVILIILIAAGVQGIPALLPIVRMALGLAFVLFVPGYAMQTALFPRDGELDGPERVALSFGLSIAVVPLLALLLDRLPWGLRRWPIVAGEGLVIAAFSGIALWRRQRIPEAERYTPSLEIDVKGWWAAQDGGSRTLYGLLAAALVVALASAVAILLQTRPGDTFTEFYVLGAEGLSEAYPHEAAAGEPVAVTVGITNREGKTIAYRIEVVVEDQTIAEAGPVELAHEATWEDNLSYALPEVGEDQKVHYHLYRLDRPVSEGAYRSLRLWIDVQEP